MKAVFRTVLLLPSFAAALGALGCGDSAGPTGATRIAGATIQGTVNPGAAAASEGVRALSGAGANIRVTVVGTSLSVTTDASGRFTIEGVPAGSVELRFQGSGMDATLRIDGLADGQVVTITVEVRGSQATLVGAPTRQQRMEVTGEIQSLSPPQFRVSGLTFVTDASTRFKGSGRVLALGDLRVGDRVEVEALQRTDGSLLALEIERKNRDDDDDGIELKGKVESITPPSLRVAGRTVATNTATRIERNGRSIALTALRTGERVEVKGILQSDGSILARKIEVEDDDD